MKSWRLVLLPLLLAAVGAVDASVITTQNQAVSCDQFITSDLEHRDSGGSWKMETLHSEAWRLFLAACVDAGSSGSNSQSHDSILYSSFALIPVASGNGVACQDQARMAVEYRSGGSWNSATIQGQLRHLLPTYCGTSSPVQQNAIPMTSGGSIGCGSNVRLAVGADLNGSDTTLEVQTKASDLFPLLCGQQPEFTQCSDGADNDGDNRVDLSDYGCSSRWDDDETQLVGPDVQFSRRDPPTSGQGGSSGWFSVFVWRNGGEGYVAMSDHGEDGGNDPIWRWQSGGWVYEGGMSSPNQVRHGFVTNATESPGSNDQHPVTGGPGYTSGRNDLLHTDGVEDGEEVCADSRYWNGACQAFGDVNGDGVDDILRSDGTVWDGATVSTSASGATGTQIGSGIPMFRSQLYTKAACLGDFGQGKVLTDEGLYDLSGNRVANLPTSGMIKGGMACGDFDSDGDIDVMFSEGGDDYSYGGTTRVFRNIDNAQFEAMPLGGLPSTGGLERRYNVSYAVDFNNDGCDDLLLSDHGRVYQSDCEFGWTLVQEFYNRGRKAVSRAGDFDGDGRIDFCASLDQQTGNPQCYRNVTE